MSKNSILVAGAGGIGQAAAIILSNHRPEDFTIFIGDRYEDAAKDIAQKINKATGLDHCHAFAFPEKGESEALKDILSQSDVILDCLPGSEAPRVAALASTYNCHYANLTEYVKETELVTEIAANANTGFVLQTGLAPGYINILAHYLFKRFTNQYKVEQVDRIEMKVGALSKHAHEPYYYAFTWSPIGVATEYVKNAVVVEDYKTNRIPSLSKTERLLINGVPYEDDYTSGGAADLPVALEGKVRNLRYKTLRYPGHYSWVRSVLEKADGAENKVAFLNKLMIDTIPTVDDDIVVVYASVTGKDHKGQLRSIERSSSIYPSEVMGFRLRAIQTTTAAPLCQMALMLLDGEFKGPVNQSQVPTHKFLNGDIIQSVYKNMHEY